jgi:hypothetical protein
MHFTLKLAAVLSAATIVGCASAPKPGSPEAAVLEERKKEEQQTKAVSKAVSNIPDWYLNPPVADNALYTAGVATSGDMQFAIDRAMLSAKTALASQLNNRVSARIRDFINEAGLANDAALTAEAERVSQNVVTEVNLAGFRREKSEVFQEGRTYRAYVLLQYPMGDANKIVRDQVRKSAQLEARLKFHRAFQELEKEIEAQRKRQ